MADKLKKIFLVDDEAANINIGKDALAGHYDVYAFESGEAMLEKVEEVMPDIILLDVNMPGMNGYEVIRNLKTNVDTVAIPVIFLTSQKDDEQELKGLEMGAVDYINKPFYPPLLRKRIDVHLLVEDQKSELITQMRVIRNLSITDALTGIYNRRGFDQAMGYMRSYFSRKKECISMMMLDIDRFKDFNDNYGHINGDKCLKIVAKTISNSLKRESDNVYRWGGEEFAILLPGTPLEDAVKIAETIRENIAAKPIKLQKKTVKVTVSISVGMVSSELISCDRSFNAFFEKLDEALFRAKANGRNRVETV